MTYTDAVNFLYSQTPQFQTIGAAAYKPGLDTVLALDKAMHKPSQRLGMVVHVAGTNGKGSTAHSIAAILQKSGYRTGLFTSPHLVDFRERIKINGEMIPQAEVVNFVQRYKSLDLHAQYLPSFFELTTVMAFDYFARMNVDAAVIEVGLGGRLDSTNIINPALSIITNISFDHMAQLGNTLESIAREKAGIMRKNVPVVCGEIDEELVEVFRTISKEKETSISFPIINDHDTKITRNEEGGFDVVACDFPKIRYELAGEYQRRNILTVLEAVRKLRANGANIPDEAVRSGLANITALTGLHGRWEIVATNPMTICDTGHNIGGWEWISQQLATLPRPLVMVLGFVADKDLTHIFPLIPSDAQLICTNACTPRSLPAARLTQMAIEAGIKVCATVPNVGAAYEKAKTMGANSIFIGGSTFVVADFFVTLQSTCQ